MTLRVLVTGGRSYLNDSVVYDYLSLLWAQEPFILVHGNCPTGVDRFAAHWAAYHGVRQEPYTPDWATYGRAAGPIRNRAMATSGVDMCVAFPGGAGTESTIKECLRVGVPVTRIQ